MSRECLIHDVKRLEYECKELIRLHALGRSEDFEAQYENLWSFVWYMSDNLIELTRDACNLGNENGKYGFDDDGGSTTSQDDKESMPYSDDYAY